KCLRVNKAIDELTAFDRVVFIQDDHRHVFDVGIERVTERNHFHERREEHEEQGHRIAPDDDEFLKQNRAEPAERYSFHFFLFPTKHTKGHEQMPRESREWTRIVEGSGFWKEIRTISL